MRTVKKPAIKLPAYVPARPHSCSYCHHLLIDYCEKFGQEPPSEFVYTANNNCEHFFDSMEAKKWTK